MSNTLLLSPAYGWFIGLLVVMIVVTGLFALILFIALRPIKKDVNVEDVSYAKVLLGRREAELTVEIMKNKGNVDVMENLISKLREVTAAEKLIDELTGGESAAASKAPAAPAKPQKAPVKPANPQAAKAPKAARPQSAQPAPAKAPKTAPKAAPAPAEKAPEVNEPASDNE